MFKFEDNDNKVFCIKDSNVELSATFETLPKDLDTITIEWTRDGKPITNSEKFKVTKTKNAIQLAIQHVQRDDAGHYTLYAKTDTGETAQKDIELLVEDRSFGDNPPVFLRRLNDLAVKVGTRTRLLVEIRSATDVRVTWYRNDRRICENDRINFVNEGSFYCLEISSITLDDGGKWMCMAENLGGRNSCLATLNVLVPKAYKAPEFVEELRAILTEQGTVSLECKVVGVPTPILRWFKDSKEIKAGDVFALTANPDDLTSLGTYTCEAVNCMGKTYSSSKLHISGKTSREGSLQPSSKLHGPPPIFTSELKSVNSKIGDSITLACQVMVPPWPKSVTWYNKEGKIELNEKYKLIEDGLGSYILEIKPAEFSDEGEWKFVVTSNEGTVSISTCSVHMDIPKNYRKPRFMENLKAILTEEGLVSFECKVVGFPTPLLRWFKDGHELKPGDVYQLTGTNSLGSYSCIARNCMGEACSSAVLTLEDIQNQLNENERIELQQKNQPPKFIKGLMSCETKINEEFKFTVQIKATTEPVFSWYRDDLPVDKTNERYEISTEKIGFCHLTIKCVEFVDQAEWKCVATNEFGHSTSTCFLKLQIPRHYKKPRFLECLRAVLTEEGAVNLECKVIGVPQPTLRWFKDGVELKPGDIHRIISGKDGECSLGTYTCEARNCMGVVTSSATLLGYEENYKSIPKPEPANILQRHLSLSTIHEERTSQLYDTPMGDITVDEKGDVSFSFDGKEVSVSLYETPDLTEEEALQIVEMYADQISEHVTEQNIVELPPLRFVKETTQSGNLLMEAVVIDVSPDYFPPEEDMRTEADMEDISVVDAMSQAFEDPLSEQSVSKRRRKEESLKSGEVEEFFSLSQSKQTKPLSVLENYVVEEAHSDEEITETDLQTFESAKSSEKGDSDKQKKIIKSDDSLQEQPPKLPPRKRPAADSKSKDEDSVYLQDISGEQGDGLKTQTKKKIDVKTITINKSIIEKVIKTVIIVKQHLIAVENEVIAQSSLMMSPTSGDSSIGIVKSVLEPINAIECKVNEYDGERNVDILVENLMPDLKSLTHGLSIIEKCVEMDSEGKTLVQRTSVCVIESVGIQMLAFLESLKQVCLHNVQGSLQNESLLIINDMQTGIHITEDTIKSQTLIQEATALEVSQRVSETVAQMQQNVPEIVPLEVVTTAELPKEANSFKLLCRYILKFQEILETCQQSDVKKETLAEIQKPIIAIQNEVHSIEEKISKNSLKDTIEEKISFKILDTVSPPLYELNKCFEAITKNVESGNKSPKILDPFILPLQEIQTGLALIGHEIDSGFIKKESPIDTEDNQKLIKNVSQNVIYVESNIENIRNSTSMTVYDSLIQLKITISTLVEKIVREPLTKGNLQIIWALKIPLEELNYCFRHIEERSTSGSLRDLLDPLNSLKENMEVVEEKLRQMRISSNVDEIKKIKSLVDQCDAEIQLFDIIQLDHQERINQQRMLEQQLSEHSQHLSEMQQKSVWNQEKCDVLTNVQQNIVNIQEIIGFENNKSFSEQLSTLKTLANPLRELSRQIANIREEILLENVNDISINDYKAILKLANPIREICQQLAVISKESTFESAQIFSSKSDHDSLKSLAVPLAELRNCIAAIQHECITLHEIHGEISHPQISLKTARPLEELRLRVEEVIHNIVEPDEISTTLDDVSVMKTMSEMSDEVKVESSQHVVKVTETKVEEVYMDDKNEEKVIEIKQHDVEASDIDEKKSQESQQHVVIQTDVETVEKIEKEAEQKAVNRDETVKVAEEELPKIIEASKQDVSVPQEQKISSEIQTNLLKMKEDMETVLIAVQNMRQPTPEVATIEKKLNGVLVNVSELRNNLIEINDIIEVIEAAEKSILKRKTSDVILVKYNLESLKKTLKIIIKTIYPDHVLKKEEVNEKVEVVKEQIEITEQKKECEEVQIIKESRKVESLEMAIKPTIETENDTNSITQAENHIKKVKILIKKISSIPELKAVEQELDIAFENFTDIATNPDKFDKAIEVINIAESKLMGEKSSDLIEIRENFATLKQILIILKTSAKTQQVKVEDIKEQAEATVEQTIQLLDNLNIIESVDKNIEKIIESTEKTELNKNVKLEQKDKSISTIIKEEITELTPLDHSESKILEIIEPKVLEIVETKSEKLEIVEQKEPELTLSTTSVVEITHDELKESESEEITKELVETVIQEKPQMGIEQFIPEIQECLSMTKNNIKTVSISIKKARRPTDELKAAEKELITILENIFELPQNQQQIVKAIEKIEEAEISLSARKTSDIVIVKENLECLKTSLIALNNSIKAQNTEGKDNEIKSQIKGTEIAEMKEELKIIEETSNTNEQEIIIKDSKSDEKLPEISTKLNESDDKSSQLPAQETLTSKEAKVEPEIEQCLLKTKDEIENVTMSIKKVRRTTSELESVQGELNIVLENISQLPENIQKVEKIIESIEKAETSLVARKTSDIVIVKESLSNLKQCLTTLTKTVQLQKVETSEVNSNPDLQSFAVSEELKIVESNECIAEKIISDKIDKTISINAEEVITEKEEKILSETPQNQIEKTILIQKDNDKLIEIEEQKSTEAIELEECIQKSKLEIEHTIESIHKIRRMTPEIQAIERQLSTTFENVNDVQNNDKFIDEILNKIETVEKTISSRRTSDISDLKVNLTNLKQSLVTLRMTIVQQNAQIHTVHVEPQQAIHSIIENKEDMNNSKPREDDKKDVIETKDESKTIDSLLIIESAEDCLKIQEQTEAQNTEKIHGAEIEGMSEIPNEVNVHLTKTKIEIENVTASVKKVRRPTNELQAAQEELNIVLEKLATLSENPINIEKVIETIEKAEASLIAKKTSDNALVKDNLTKLKQALTLLHSVVKTQKTEVQDISKIPQTANFEMIESSEELKIVESNENLAEKIEEKIIDKLIIIETPEKITELQKEKKTLEEPKISENKIVSQEEEKSAKPEEICENKIVPQNEEKSAKLEEIPENKIASQDEKKPAELQECLEKSKQEIEHSIESIHKIRRITPEIQAIERQLSTTFGNVNDISNDDKVIDGILCQIEAAEASITIRKTSDAVTLKENFASLKQSLVMLKSVIVQQIPQTESIFVQPQQAEISLNEKDNKDKDNEKIVEIVQNQKSITEEIKLIDVEKIHDKEKENKLESVEKLKEIEEVKSEIEPILPPQTEIQSILPEIQECLTKTKENIETVTISIKKARRSTDELQAAQKELTIVLENISQLPQNQQQIEQVIEKIEKAEASLVARKTSDILLVKENLISLKKSLTILNNTIKAQNIQLSAVKEVPQIANLQIIESSDDLKIVESNESLAEKVHENIIETAKDVEIIKEKESTVVKIEAQVLPIEQIVKQSEDIKPQDIISMPEEQIINKKQEESEIILPLDISIEFCIKQSKTDIENTIASIKSVRHPTLELQAAEKSLSITLEKIFELPASEELIEKAMSSIENAESSLVTKKTSDMVLVKQNLSNLKESFATLKSTIIAQQPIFSDVSSVQHSANLQINEKSEDLKIVESNENISMIDQPIKKSIEKSNVEIENTIESIKKMQKPTVELQATEKELLTALEHLSDLQHDKKKIEKVIESIVAAETSLTARKTSDVVLMKENLSELKESLSTLKTNFEEFKVNTVNTETPTFDVKKLELPVIEPSNDLKIVESNEDLTEADEVPKIEELEGLQIIENEQLTEVALSLAKSRDEIENVMFAIRKARHPPTEVCAVEKVLTSTYEQLFELPKDENFIDKAIESIELAEISLVTRGAGDLIVIKNNLGVLKESLIKIISFTNPQKADSLLHELQKPQVAEVSEVQEIKQVEEEEKPQELTIKQKIDSLIEKTIDSIRNSRRPIPEVQAIEKEFTLELEKVSNLENDKQEIEKIIALIETAETSLAAKRTSDAVLIKENLALVKETLNTLKLTAQSKPIEIIEMQQKPEQAIIVDEKLKVEDLKKDIVDKKSIEKQQKCIELKESEAKLPLQSEIQETQKQQPNENFEKLKTEIVSTIESIKKVRRPTTEIQAVEKELTMVVEHVNALPNDEKKIENVITIIESTEASLAAKKTSDIMAVRNNLSVIKQTLKVIKNATESMKKESEPDLEKNTEEDKIEQSNRDEKSVTERLPVDSETKKPVESKQEKSSEVLGEKTSTEKVSLPKEQESLKLNMENLIQSIKKSQRPTTELEDTQKIILIAYENVSEFTENVEDVQKAIESIIVAEVSLIAKRTSDMVIVKNCLTTLKEKLTDIKNNLKTQKIQISEVEETTKIDYNPKEKINKINDEPKKEPKKIDDKSKDEPKKFEDKLQEEPKKIEDKPKEEPKKIDDKPQEKPKKIDDKPQEEPKKIDDKPQEEPKKIDDKPQEKPKKIDDKPQEEPKKIDDKPQEEEPKKIDDKPQEEPKKIDDKPQEKPKKIDDKPQEEPKKIDDKPQEEEPKKMDDKPKEKPKKIEDKPEEEPKKIDDKPQEKINKINDEPKKEPKKIDDKPQEEEPKKMDDKPKEESKKIEDKPEEEPKKIDDKPEEEPKKIDDKLQEKPKKIDDKPQEEPKKMDDKPKEKPKKIEDKPEEEPKKIDDKPEEEPKKIDDKLQEKPKKIDDKPQEEPKKMDDKPKEKPKKIEDKPEEEPKKIDEKLSAELIKAKIEVKDVIDSIKKVRRATIELNTAENVLKTVLENIKEIPSDQENLQKVLLSIQNAETSITTRRTSDILVVKEKLNSLKDILLTFKSDKIFDEIKDTIDKINSKPKEELNTENELKSEETENLKSEKETPEEPTKIEVKPVVQELTIIRKLKKEIANVTATIKKVRRPTPELQNVESELTIVVTKLPEFENDFKMVNKNISIIDKAEDSIITKKTSDMLAVKESLAKLKDVLTEIRNSIKQSAEMQNVVEELSVKEEVIEEKIEIKTQDDLKSNEVTQSIDESKHKEELKPIETEIPKEMPKVDDNLKVPESPSVRKLKTTIENVLVTIKKVRRPTPELQAVESELSIVLNTLPEFENDFKQIVKNIGTVEKAEDSIITKKTSDMLAVKECLSKLKNILSEKRDSIKQSVNALDETNNSNDEEKSKNVESKTKEDIIEIKKQDETKSNEDVLQVNENKPNVETQFKENVQPIERVKPLESIKIEDIAKVSESATIQKLRTEIENVFATIKKVRRATPELLTTENELTIIIKKLCDFENDTKEIDKTIKIIVKAEDSIITKRTSDMTAVKESLLSLKNLLTEIINLKKPKIVEKIEEVRADEKIEPETSIQNHKINEKTTDSVISDKETKEIEKLEVKEIIPEIKLDEISLKIKSEIENVIHSIKKSRRPTTEIQSLEKSLNTILDLKILSDFSKNLKQINETLKSIDITESSLASKKTSDMILVKNNISLLKEILISCKNKLTPSQAKDKQSKPFEESLKQEVIKEDESKIAELPKELEQPSEVLLDIHEKDLMFQYIISIKQDIEEVLVMIKKTRRPSTELQMLHEALIDLKPNVDNLSKDSVLFDKVLNIVSKAKTALLTKRTMDMILLREKVTSLENSLTLLKSTIVTEINGELIAAKQLETKVAKETETEQRISNQKEIDSIQQNIETVEQKEKIIENDQTPKEEQVKIIKEISQETIRQEELEPQKPVRRRKYEEPAKIEENTKPEAIKKEESKSQITLETEIAPVPTERRRQRITQENQSEIQNETEPVKPSRRRRAEELKEEEKSLSRTPETRRKRMPTFIARLKNRSASENSILKLTCAVSEPEVSARWTKQGMALKDSEKYSIENSNGVLSLEIKNACAQDAGEYFCFVSNSCGEIETSAFVTIFGEDVQPSNTTFTKNLRGD